VPTLTTSRALAVPVVLLVTACSAAHGPGTVREGELR